MSREISPVLSESFEDVLNAVQETARGRWFLEEYASRKKSEDTASILAAIVKLESVMARVPAEQKQAEPALIEKAKSAISRAKAQIRGLATEDSPLSREAQLFAKLADLSRTAFSDAVDDDTRQALGRSMEVALRLVSELDQNFSNGEPANTNVEGQKYFHQDSDIFEPSRSKRTQATAPIATVAKSETEVSTKPEAVARGAKLSITRQSSAPNPANDSIEEPPTPPALESDAVNLDTADLAKPAPEPDKAHDQRIIIVRRKPDEAIDVPLFDKPGNASAA